MNVLFRIAGATVDLLVQFFNRLSKLVVVLLSTGQFFSQSVEQCSLFIVDFERCVQFSFQLFDGLESQRTHHFMRRNLELYLL